MNCEEIKEPDFLEIRVKETSGLIREQLFDCFYKIFFPMYARYAYKYCSRRPVTSFKEDELIHDSFSDGLLDFCLKIKNDGFRKEATVKTVFFCFCINKIRESIQRLYREKGKQVFSTESFDNIHTLQTDDLNAALEEFELLEANEKILNAALNKLGDRGATLIISKKVLKKSNEDIARQLNITPGSVPNEIYKAFLKLKQIIKNF